MPENAEDVDLKIKKIQLEREKIKVLMSGGCAMIMLAVLLPLLFLMGTCSYAVLTSH